MGNAHVESINCTQVFWLHPQTRFPLLLSFSAESTPGGTDDNYQEPKIKHETVPEAIA